MPKTYILLAFILTSFWQCKKIQNNTQKDKSKLELITTFPKELNENSTLWIEDENHIWTLNDSGGSNYIYQINTQGQITHKLLIKNATNIDWEALSADKNYFYIADTGNNEGNRTDLVIYKIKKEDLKKQQCTAEKIYFYYPEQIDFSKKTYQHDFDCEAIYIYNNLIHIITKAWKTEISSHYTIPNTAGNHRAKYIQKLDTQGLITDVCIEKNKVHTIQYTREGAVTLFTFNIKNNQLFLRKSEKFPNTKKIGQIEGIGFYRKKLYISGEDYEGIPANLYQIKK